MRPPAPRFPTIVSAAVSKAIRTQDVLLARKLDGDALCLAHELPPCPLGVGPRARQVLLEIGACGGIPVGPVLDLDVLAVIVIVIVVVFVVVPV
jgi:hypothetical protein